MKKPLHSLTATNVRVILTYYMSTFTDQYRLVPVIYIETIIQILDILERYTYIINKGTEARTGWRQKIFTKSPPPADVFVNIV